jgi:ribosome modulation factor
MATDEESLAHDYVDGRNARRHGQSLKDCPYPPRSSNGERWVEGWKDVDDEVAAEGGNWAAKVRVAERKLVGEIGRSRLAINAARAAGFPLEGIEDLHDKLISLYRFE